MTLDSLPDIHLGGSPDPRRRRTLSAPASDPSVQPTTSPTTTGNLPAPERRLRHLPSPFGANGPLIDDGTSVPRGVLVIDIQQDYFPGGAYPLVEPVAVVENGCAAPNLTFQGTVIPGRTVHAAFMAALGDAGARVISA